MKNKIRRETNGNKIEVALPWPQRLFGPPYGVLSAILEACAITPPNMAPNGEGSRLKKRLVPRQGRRYWENRDNSGKLRVVCGC